MTVQKIASSAWKSVHLGFGFIFQLGKDSLSWPEYLGCNVGP